ncbi:hypothetical protein [Proteiniphilum sp. X52]|uniref:hypothetical protein n=1 Tax=Proteiniphilum sp. X52 TaxID=2382159 RepID=UPI000F0A555F|nr:hypothetical protein [Proteiniphilum sp. X52]RNC67012.1 hypothetical protein D7D25_01850 [Proteiniphilum sp. X52]
MNNFIPQENKTARKPVRDVSPQNSRKSRCERTRPGNGIREFPKIYSKGNQFREECRQPFLKKCQSINEVQQHFAFVHYVDKNAYVGTFGDLTPQ